MEDNTYEEFASSTIGHLKDFLSARGLSCTGSKQELVSICFVAWESKTPLKFQNQTGSMNMLSEFCNAPQSPYPVPSLIEQRKISDRGLLLASSSKLHPWVIYVCLFQPGVIICLKSARKHIHTTSLVLLIPFILHP
jgi:hypothetical protein